jgi:hypothetical protein
VRERAANSQIARRLYFQSSSYKRDRQAEKKQKTEKIKIFFPVKRVKSEQRIH